MPGDGPPRGPPIGGAPGGGSNPITLLGKRKALLIAVAGTAVGAAAALVPRFVL